LISVLGGPAAPVAGTEPSRMALAPPMACKELGALRLGHHPLSLHQQVVFWALPQGPGEEDDRDARAAALIAPQDLLRLCAGQALRRVHLEPGATQWRQGPHAGQAHELGRAGAGAPRVVHEHTRGDPVQPAAQSLFSTTSCSWESQKSGPMGTKALLDALKVKTMGRQDGRLLYYFGAIWNDDAASVTVEYIQESVEHPRLAKLRVQVSGYE
jgi:hypothetical protein